MADLSSVVSFLTGSFLAGMSASLLLAFRGPARLPGVFAGPFTTFAGGLEAVAAPASVAELSLDVPGALLLSTSSEGIQRGHFLASSESAGTSTTSLHGYMRRRRKGGETGIKVTATGKGSTHVVSSPANL